MSETSASAEHVVFFTTALGDPAAERHPSQQAAVSRVESLCNEDHVQDAKVYALVPVPLCKRSYWHVAVDGTSLLGALSVPSTPAAPATPPQSATRETVVEPAQGTAPTTTPDLGEDDSPVAAPELGQDFASEPSQEPTPSDANPDEPETAHGADAGSTYDVDVPVSDVFSDAF